MQSPKFRIMLVFHYVSCMSYLPLLQHQRHCEQAAKLVSIAFVLHLRLMQQQLTTAEEA